MVCYSPLRAYWSKRKHHSTGNDFLVFTPSKSKNTDYFTVPCGKCEGCLLDRSFSWSVRCTCESYYHSENYFLTLTYDKEHLPEDHLLNRVHVQQFVKRLRKHFSGYKLRIFYCGEYGERRHRPHYHMIVFGLPLSEKNYRLFPLNYSRKGNVNYFNPILTKLWQKGICTIGSFSSSSASYVAQYTMKKNKENFKFLNNPNFPRSARPFIGMSNRPGIGQKFFDDYYKDIFYRGGFNINLGNSTMFVRPLRFFVKKLKEIFPILHHTLITRPARLLRLMRSRYGGCLSPDETRRLDKKIINRYIKEQRTLRKLEARSDL